jgi:translation initiation factor 3 subunit A
MGCTFRGELSVRIDHAAGSIAFVDALEGSAAAAPDEKNKTDAAVQPSVAELVRTLLGSVARYLHNAIEAIGPSPSPAEASDRTGVKLRFPLVLPIYRMSLVPWFRE